MMMSKVGFSIKYQNLDEPIPRCSTSYKIIKVQNISCLIRSWETDLSDDSIWKLHGMVLSCTYIKPWIDAMNNLKMNLVKRLSNLLCGRLIRSLKLGCTYTKDMRLSFVYELVSSLAFCRALYFSKHFKDIIIPLDPHNNLAICTGQVAWFHSAEMRKWVFWESK